MCGIVGIASKSLPLGDAKSLLSNMGKRIEHRGPDDAGEWTNETDGVYLGHKRLSIIDVSSAGHQPMVDATGKYVIVFNGEIYNFQEIRRTLESAGVRFRSHSDTEVLLEGYKHWGTKIVSMLRGMFAFALWDGKEHALFLGRDRLGKKPLYYWESSDRNTFLFGSEMKAILAHNDVGRVMNPVAVSSYVQLGYVIAPHTMFRDIKKIRPGRFLIRSNGGTLREERYWRIQEMGTDTRDRKTLVKETRDRLAEAVRLRLISDVPLGAFLSGGVDSTTNVALMSRLMNQPVRTFTVAHDIGPRSVKYNVDARHARLASGFYHTDHHELVLENDLDIQHSIGEVLRHLDEPYTNYSYLSTFGLAQFIKRNGVTVALSGDGSDEIFGGYSHYALERWVSRLRHVPSPIRHLAKHFSSSIAKGVDKSFVQAKNPGMYFNWRNQIPLSFLSKPDPHPEFLHEVQSILDEAPTENSAERLMYADLVLWIAEESNMRMDKLNMASAVESRAPFLDHELVEFAMRVPLKWKIRNGKGKALLRDAVAPLIPDEVLNRQKWGFFAPVHYWMKDQLSDFVQSVLTQETVAEAGVFRPDTVAALARSGQQPFTLWGLMTFHLWYTSYIKR